MTKTHSHVPKLCEWIRSLKGILQIAAYQVWPKWNRCNSWRKKCAYVQKQICGI